MKQKLQAEQDKLGDTESKVIFLNHWRGKSININLVLERFFKS